MPNHVCLIHFVSTFEIQTFWRSDFESFKIWKHSKSSFLSRILNAPYQSKSGFQIFSNLLTPLFRTYLGIPRSVGPRNKRWCFQHRPKWSSYFLPLKVGFFEEFISHLKTRTFGSPLLSTIWYHFKSPLYAENDSRWKLGTKLGGWMTLRFIIDTA